MVNWQGMLSVIAALHCLRNGKGGGRAPTGTLFFRVVRPEREVP